VKTYAHSLRLQQERLEDVSDKKLELSLAIDKKRLELLKLKQAQLTTLKQQDPRIAQSIQELAEKLKGYETQRAAEVELPKGVVRLGRKAPDGNVVPVQRPQSAQVAPPPAE
jgi:hypothetical protein